MRQVLYALFKEPGEAEAALEELSRIAIPKEECQIFVHRKKLNQDLRTSESDLRRGLLVGLCTGALGGAFMGWLLAGPLSVLQLPLYAAIGFLMFLGAVCGMIGGGLSGNGFVHTKLNDLLASFRPGETLVTAEIDGEQWTDMVYRIFKMHGAIEVYA